MKAIIIDDELQSINTLQAKLRLITDDIDVVATFQDPREALLEVKKHAPDVLFVDIEMPGLNGFQFLEQLRPYDFPVVFVTAYNQYAIRALRMSALDYLLKPIDIDELKRTIERLREQTTRDTSPQYDDRMNVLFEALKSFSNQNPNPLSDRIALSTQQGVLFVGVKDILRVEAGGNYSSFFMLSKQRIIVSRTLKEFEDVLQSYNFLRISRSNLVNLNQIVKYQKGDGGTLFLTDSSELAVSPNYKSDLLERLPFSSK
ncbi:MAG: LytTR family DNA-binding domain-containing protein [Saprospiraceae bacterium]|nr:LytTR family DNA-binding domain-containing protein [Saprospiraceae bacterium]